jgi:hypothetical protein
MFLKVARGIEKKEEKKRRKKIHAVARPWNLPGPQ